ncbi:MAG: hypothetical protein CO113_08350 [Elusimicrobia bacterium CG_4_9_14_3_um_filter_62_55]|nr:MAG: hypothetical protein COR54_03965 [Elusimicrobia bacterium CG22_combo_CG10-13_8_21_14_all_63_91]PJB25507.1 MAG: hypothetical protein CO113_08350 [Elusimicrobia bacterium CG_4_9_14_3_um_filter_62_55]
MWEVLAVKNSTAELRKDVGIETRSAKVSELIVIRRFGEAIYPALVSVDRIVIQELSESQPNVQDRRKEDDAIRAIRTKWNSFRDLQNAFIQRCLQLGEEIRSHASDVTWGTYIDHFQTLE